MIISEGFGGERLSNGQNYYKPDESGYQGSNGFTNNEMR